MDTDPLVPGRLSVSWHPVDAADLVAELRLGPGAADHDGALHRGVLAALLLAVGERAASPRRAPVTSLDASLQALPSGPLSVRVAQAHGVGRWEAALRAPDGTGVGGSIELAGRDPRPRVADLVDLAGHRLPSPASDPRNAACAGCGEGLLVKGMTADVVQAGWAPDDSEAGADGLHLSPRAALVRLACAGTWLTGAPARHLHARWFSDPATYEPLRIVARRDEGASAATPVRAALLDEDGVVHAMVATTHPRE